MNHGSTKKVLILSVSMQVLQKQSAIRSGYDLEINDMAFEAILAAISSGKADFGAAGMTVNEERLKSVDFTDTYANASQVVIVRK